jgi:hypothetical protein
MPWLSRYWSTRLSALLCVGAALLPAWSGKALAEKWEVEDGWILGEDGKRSRDVSGIACTTSTGLPRHCLMIDDNLQTGQFVTVKEGKLEPGKAVPLIDNSHDDEKLELDGEGVAFFGDSFYVIGSHGHPRHQIGDGTPKSQDKIKAKIAAASQIVRIRLKGSIGNKLSMNDVLEIRRTGKLREFIAADKTLAKYMDQPLELRADGTGNGVTIEGVAILDGRLFAGFRGPSIKDRGAPILSVPLEKLFGEGLDGAEITVVKLDNGRGVRDLVAYGKGLLVLAGPTGDEAGRYEVHWWDGRSVDMQPLGDITQEAHAKKTSKPEGLLPLDESSRGLRLLILSDGDDAKDGEPRSLLVKIPKQ